MVARWCDNHQGVTGNGELVPDLDEAMVQMRRVETVENPEMFGRDVGEGDDKERPDSRFNPALDVEADSMCKTGDRMDRSRPQDLHRLIEQHFVLKKV